MDRHPSVEKEAPKHGQATASQLGRIFRSVTTPRLVESAKDDNCAVIDWDALVRNSASGSLGESFANIMVSTIRANKASPRQP